MDTALDFKEKERLQKIKIKFYNFEKILEVIEKKEIRVFDQRGRGVLVTRVGKINIIFSSTGGAWYPWMDSSLLVILLLEDRRNERIFQEVKGFLQAEKSLQEYIKIVPRRSKTS